MRDITPASLRKVSVRGFLCFRHGRTRGLTLIEFLLVLVCLVSCLVLGIRWVRGHRVDARCMAMAEELRGFDQVFQKQVADGSQPPKGEGTPGEYPKGMELRLAETSWAKTSPFGGRYAWLSPCPPAWNFPRKMGGPKPIGAVLLTAWAPDARLTLTAADIAQIQAVLERDQRLRGCLRQGYNGWPMILVYP